MAKPRYTVEELSDDGQWKAVDGYRVRSWRTAQRGALDMIYCANGLLIESMVGRVRITSSGRVVVIY